MIGMVNIMMRKASRHTKGSFPDNQVGSQIMSFK